jgi:MscS family membrane protein
MKIHNLIKITLLFTLQIFFSLPSQGQIPSAAIKASIEKAKASTEESSHQRSEVSQKYEELEKLKSPRETMRTFLEAMDEVKNGKNDVRSSFDQAARTFNLSEVEENFRERVGRRSAERLINTIDRIAKINLENIPQYSSGSKWYFRKQVIESGEQKIDAEIAIEKNADGAWRFSIRTVETIDALYSTMAHLPVVTGVIEYKNWRTRFKSKMPKWMGEETFLFTKGQWVGFIVIFIIGILALSFVRLITTKYIHDLVKKESLNFKEKDHFKSTLPFGLLAFSLICLGGIRLLELDLDSYQFLVRAFYILTAFSSVWSSLKIVDLISMHFAKVAKDTSNKFDDVLVPMLAKTAKVVVISFGAILVAHSLTFDIGSILAGLGIGGVAVALAAKDTISNLFGSVTVIIDQPFLMGDYVVLDKGLEGTVEEVGFRSTRIRTPYQSVVSLPNNVLANMAIDNYGMRTMRRFRTHFHAESSTSALILEDFCERIRYLINIHQLIDNHTSQVYVHDMTEKSITILINIFFQTTDGNVELQERHKFILEVLKLANEVGIKFSQQSPTYLIEKK